MEALQEVLERIIFYGAAVAAIGGITAFVWKVFKWIEHQREQDEDLKHLREEFEIKESERDQEEQCLKDEQCLLTYGLLACLKGLQELGCDGPVSEAINKIEKHLNQAAHS